jgi:ribosome-associated protein
LKLSPAESLNLARLCFSALEEKKAGDLRVIDVTDLSSITNYLVIGTATSEPHVRALRVELEKALDSVKTHIVGVDTTGESGWAVMDAFDVMVHIFTPETRARYRLEHLWRDGTDISRATLFNEKKDLPKAPAKKKAKVSAKPAPKAPKKASSRRPKKGK